MPYSDDVYLNYMIAKEKNYQYYKQEQTRQEEIKLDNKQMEQIEKKIAEEILKKLMK